MRGEDEFRELGSWFKRGIWSILDQAIFTISNLLLNVMLARSLPAAGYGTFALGFTILLCLGIAHTALITEPMLVFGGRYQSSRKLYLGVILRGHLRFSFGASAVVALAAALLTPVVPEFTTTLISLAANAPLILFLWLMRRACYLHLQPKHAACAGLLYLTLMGGILIVLKHELTISAESGFVAMGLASFGAGVWLLARSGSLRHVSRANPLVPEVTTLHWKYARWSIASGFLAWIPANFFYVFLPLAGLLEVSASVRALMNFIMPAVQAITAMSTLLLPALVRARGTARFAWLVKVFVIALLVGTIVYWFALGLLHQPLVSLLYDGRYDQHAAILWALGALPSLVGIAAVAGSVFRALERPDVAFWAHLAAASITVTVGSLISATYGLVGAVAGILLGWSVLTAYLCVVLARSTSSWALVPASKNDREDL